MKCVLCQYDNNQVIELKKHYIEKHNVNENNVFFKRLISQNDNALHCGKCNFCKEFVLKKNDHNFLKHYGRGFDVSGDVNDDNDNVKQTTIGAIRKFEITFNEHTPEYDFFDPVALVDKFLGQVEKSVVRYDNDVLIRAGFSIENIQQPLDNYSEPLLQTRYWSTEPIQTKSFNDFVLFNIRESILKRVINNKLSGSAWNFNKFNYLNIKILDTAAAQLVR